MPCDFFFGWSNKGNTVTYPPLRDRKRNNRGFCDGRGLPNEAAKIAECSDSDELKYWLISLARPESPIFSLGCDIGKYHSRKHVPHPYATGGYIQLLAADYTACDIDQYKSLAKRMYIVVNDCIEPSDWEVSFL